MKICDNGKMNVLKSGKIINEKSIITVSFYSNNVFTIRLSQLAAMGNFKIRFLNFWQNNKNLWHWWNKNGKINNGRENK